MRCNAAQGIFSSPYLKQGITFLGVLWAVFLVFPLLTRECRAQAQSGTTLRVDVELVTVEVSVLDKKGNPVSGLKKENFRLYEDGKQQQVTTFDEVVDKPGEVVPTSLADIDDSVNNRGKVVLILFDDSTIKPSQLKMSRDSAEKYVKEHMRPWDFFAVATYGMSLKILQNLTHDSAKVIEAIRQPASSFATNAARLRSNDDTMTGQQPGQRSRQQRNELGNSPMNDREAKDRAARLLRTLNYLSSSVSKVRGRKTILLYSEDFSITPDIQAEYTNAVTSATRSNVSFYTIDAKGLNAATGPETSQLTRPEPVTSGAGENPLARSTSWTSLISGLLPVSSWLNPLPQALLSTAMFQQGGGQSGGQGGGQTGGGQSGGTTGGGNTGAGNTGAGNTGGTSNTGNTTPSNTNTNTNNTNTTNTLPGRDASSGRFGDDTSRELPTFQEAIMDNILRSLATETGGLAIYNTNNFNERLDRVDLELSNYYVLGFQSSNPKRDGKFRKLEVKTDMKGLNIKHRKGYVDPRPLDVLAGSKGERSLMTAIASPTLQTQLPVVFRSVYFYDSPALARVPLSAKIRTGSMELKKKGSLLTGEINVMGVAYSEDGSVAARFSETLHISLEKEKEESFRKQDIAYKNYFRLRPGKYQLKLAVSDEKGKVGSAESTMTVPPMPTSGLVSSSLVVADQMLRLPELIQNLQAKLLDEADPMIFAGLQIMPSVENQIPRDSAVRVFYKLYNLGGNPEQRKLSAKIQLVNEKGEAQALPAIPLNQNVFPTGKEEAAIGINLPFEKLSPGKYKLVIETSEASTNQTVTNQTDLLFM